MISFLDEQVYIREEHDLVRFEHIKKCKPFLFIADDTLCCIGSNIDGLEELKQCHLPTNWISSMISFKNQLYFVKYSSKTCSYDFQTINHSSIKASWSLPVGTSCFIILYMLMSSITI